jgi:hypothetical protein
MEKIKYNKNLVGRVCLDVNEGKKFKKKKMFVFLSFCKVHSFLGLGTT